MAQLAIRELAGDEMLEAIYPLTSYAFHASPPLRDKEEWKENARLREGITYFAMFEGEKPVSGAGGTPLTQNVRGHIYPGNGIWGVATAPEARRKGYCRRVMQRFLAAQREAGHAFSSLYPFRESFYERLGYVTFPQSRVAHLIPTNLAPLLKQDLDGQVELLSIGDGYDAYRAFLYRMQQETHGMAVFTPANKERARRNQDQWMALATAGGQVAGVMIYQLEGKEVARFLLRATRFYYAGGPGRYLLLQWIARHIDQADRAEIILPCYERPEAWLSDLQVRTESHTHTPMVRVLDVRRAGGMHVGAGQFSARILDPLCPWNEGDWAFCSEDGLLRVAPAQTPECSLSIQGLAGLMFGTHDPGDFAVRGWGDPAAHVQRRMRQMFPPLQPHLHEFF